MWKSRFYGAFVLNRRIGLHAIDATPARWRGDAGSSPPDRARTEHLTHWLISTQVAIIEDAEKRGELKPGMTVVEATSGNTGIAVAMVCAQRGYDCVICMAEPFSVERRRLMRMLGAKVIVTPKAGKGTGLGLAVEAGASLLQHEQTLLQARHHQRVDVGAAEARGALRRR